MGSEAMVDNTANDADDTAAAGATDNDASPRFMPSIEEAGGGKGDDNDTPTAFLLVRFIKKKNANCQANSDQ
jgi:hypothetical protein